MDFCNWKGIVVEAFLPLGSTGSPLFCDESVRMVAEKHGVGAGSVLPDYEGSVYHQQLHFLQALSQILIPCSLAGTTHCGASLSLQLGTDDAFPREMLPPLARVSPSVVRTPMLNQVGNVTAQWLNFCLGYIPTHGVSWLSSAFTLSSRLQCSRGSSSRRAGRLDLTDCLSGGRRGLCGSWETLPKWRIDRVNDWIQHTEL